MSSSPSLTRASSSLFLLLVSGFWILASLTAPAIVDTNNNTLSDIWEKQYNNGNLLTNLNPQADPDSDGWTNMQEAAAGTNPFNPNPPNGFIRPNIVHIPATYIPGTNGDPVIFTPEAITLTWPTLAGKQYTLHYSPDLSIGSWQPVEAPYIGSGNNTQYGIPLTQANGSTPDKLFWRVAVGDIDSDGDTLSNYEESILGTNSNNIDTDFDGIADNLDPLPSASATLADPDGTNPPAGSTTNLRGFWDFESQQVVGSAINFPDRSGNNRHATSSGPGPQLLGMPSKAARIGSGHITVPIATVQGQSTYTISGWFKLAKDSIKTSNGIFRVIYALYDQVGIGPAPQYVRVSQGSILYLRNTVAGEQWFIGGYRQFPYYNQYPYSNGNPGSEFSGHYFMRPSGTSDDGQWHHFAATRSTASNGQKLYLDGKLVIQGALIEYPVAYDSDTTLTFGSLYPGHTPTNFPDAHIDRLRIHSKLLTQTEITALCRQDIDKDGLWDITETSTRYSDYSSSVIIHPDPTNPNPPQPTQTGYARSPFLHSSAALDFDQDELNDLAEQTAGTSLTKPDTDDDNLSDGFEISNNFNPLNAYSSGTTGPRDDLSDPDSDTLTTFTEYLNGSNPRNANSDGDGKSDAQEIAQGSDPGNAADSGKAPTDPPEPVPFRINGDYTAWEATLKGKGPNDTRTRRLRMTSHNVAADQVLPLLRGNAYELSLRYIRTRPGEKVPWYCWEASIAGKNAPSFTIADHWVVDNSSAVLAPHTHSHGTNRVVNKKLNLLPVEFEVKHTEIDPATGQVVNPRANTMLRDEIVDIRIKIPPLGTTDWTVDLTVEPEAMRTQNLPNRGDVKMHDFGQVETNGTVTPDKTQFVLQASAGGEQTIKAVFNKEGILKIKMKSTDGKIDFTSPDYTIQKRMRKYASLPSSENHDLNQHDKAFVDAANHWGGVYQHQVDDVERLKAMGMAESELGLTDATDILTVGNAGDHVLDTFRNVPPYDRLPGVAPAGGLALREVDIANNSTRMLSYPAANETPAATAIHWGVCWLYQKASSIQNNPNPPQPPDPPNPYIPGPWRSWDTATERYNGGGVPNYLQRINRSMKEGRHPSNANLYIWPMKSNKKARGN